MLVSSVQRRTLSPDPGSESRVRVTVLDGGLTVATDPMPGVHSAALGLWIDAGARHEQADENGVAHFLEHMLFKGTRHRSAQQIAEQVEDIGGSINAHTAREHTAIYLRVLGENVPLAVDILADVLQHSTLDEKEFRHERQVILQEIGQVRDTPDDLIFDLLQSCAFPEQPLGRPILGEEATLETMTPRTLRSFINTHFDPSQIVLSASGAVNHDDLVRLAVQHFAVPERPSLPRPLVQPGRYQAQIDLQPMDLEQAHVALAFPSLSYTNADVYAVTVLSTLLGGGMSSRLFQEVRENRGLAYSIFSFCAAYRDTGLFGIYAGTSPEEIPTLMDVIREQVASAVTQATEAEIRRAKAQVSAGLLMAQESTSARSEQLANNLLMYGRPVSVAETLEAIEAVDARTLARVGQLIFGAAPSITVLSPRLPEIDASVILPA